MPRLSLEAARASIDAGDDAIGDEVPDVEGLGYVIRVRAAGSRVERIALPCGAYMTRIAGQHDELGLATAANASPPCVEFAQPALLLQHLRRGRDAIVDRATGESLEFGHGIDHARFQKRFQLVNRFARAEPVELISVVLPLPALQGLLGRPLAERLLVALEVGRGQYGRAVPSVLEANHLLYDAFAPNRGDTDVHRLRMQSRLTAWLAALVERHGRIDATSDARLAQLVDEIRAAMLERIEQPPSIDDLARRHGVPTRLLADAFKARCGVSVHQFLVDQRLERALEAVRFGDVPLKVLAARLGYRHVTNFSTAFKARFGVPPATLRRQSQQA